MDITTDEKDGFTVIRLSGNLDTTTSGPAQERIEALIEAGANRMLISLRDVGFVSSAGLRILLVAAKKMVMLV